MGVQAFRPELAVQAFDEGIVCWLARPREVQRNTAHERPQIELLADKFGPVVEPDRLRIADLAAVPSEFALKRITIKVDKEDLYCCFGSLLLRLGKWVPSALTQTEGTGWRLILARMTSAGLVQTKGLGSALCTSR